MKINLPSAFFDFSTRILHDKRNAVAQSQHDTSTVQIDKPNQGLRLGRILVMQGSHNTISALHTLYNFPRIECTPPAFARVH
jgi:hypothetical protein